MHITYYHLHEYTSTIMISFASIPEMVLLWGENIEQYL
jgi:hypothetical protein